MFELQLEAACALHSSAAPGASFRGSRPFRPAVRGPVLGKTIP
eukprot:COSAG02_NODE_68023_length_251_cov_1.026316_1_plen_42_part_10